MQRSLMMGCCQSQYHEELGAMQVILPGFDSERVLRTIEERKITHMYLPPLLPPGESGEIVVRGALVTHSYFEKPEATAEVRTIGWHHTCDVARRDTDGYLYIVDRKKDMGVSGGFNVFTTEVEAAITELPQIRECTVIGIPHEKWGEQVHAIVVAEGIDAAAIIAHAKDRLGSVKAPKSVQFIDSIPRTAAGKMDKKALRIEHWGENARMVN